MRKMWDLIKISIFLLLFSQSLALEKFELSAKQSNVKLVVEDFKFMVQASVKRGEQIIQIISLTPGIQNPSESSITENELTLNSGEFNITIKIEVDTETYTQFSINRNGVKKFIQDCIKFEKEVNWYGANEQQWQSIPIQNLKYKHESYLTKSSNSFAIAERYWLNSNGVFFHVDLEAPLFIDQNSDYANYICFEGKKSLPYDISTKEFDFRYNIGVANNAREAHIEAVNRFLQKPLGHPDEVMVKRPIFSTWARYKAFVNDSVVREFAKEILEQDYKNIQLEIDDDWEICYGAHEFRTSKFPNIRKLTDDLKAMGFRVSLWIHPFINKDCEPYYSEAKSKGYFVKNHAGSTDTSWWRSGYGQAAHIDFTNTEAKEWFVNRLKKLQTEAGIDSFKFDAGESSWTPEDPVLNGPSNLFPHLTTIEFVKTVSQFGGLIEARTGQNTQNLPMFIRMIDKDSEWSNRNGLPTLITTLLQMNLNGYVMVLPDMVGGNGYGNSINDNNPPDAELYIRWLQANVFMPAIQFSYCPWQYDEEIIEASQKLVQLHEKYSDLIIERFQLAMKNGDPVNPPVWWISPNDKIAQTISDQFLLGETILVAPVIIEGQTKRDIYLPEGTWKDGNSENIEKGPKWVMGYDAPLDVLPYFIKQ